MSLSSFEQIVDLTPPSILIVEWGYILRSMYMLTGIREYNHIANVLSDIIESNPGCGRKAICHTNILELVLSRCII